MAFEIQIVGAEELSSRHLLTQVTVDRPLYDHTRAELTLHWQEGSLYEDRQTAFLAAKLLNCPIDIQWKDNDLTEHVTCFHGYIEDVRGHRETSSSSLALSCVSFSRRTDLIPRYRTFQATTLLEIASQIAKSEPLIKINQAGDMDLPIVLSVQHGETDFAYLSRMLHAWAVPMMISDKTGQVILGARGVEAQSPFPDSSYGWSEINFSGTLEALPYLASGGSGPVGVAQGRVQAHNAELPRKAAYYYGIPDAPAITKRVSEAASRTDTSGYHLVLNGAVLAFSPGDVVGFEGQQHLVRSVRVTGHPQQTTATQEFWLQPLTLPLAPERSRPVWSSRALWSHVTANEHDPLHQGRIQVEFEWEHLDPQASHERAWLHTLTPYGGGSGSTGVGGRQSGQYSGFFSLPEIGERVLVEFLGDWDSEAVVIGGIREYPQEETYNPHQTKRWSTPSGNEVLMHTVGAKDVVQMKNQGKMVFESQLENGTHSLTMNSGGNPGDTIHFQGDGASCRLDISVATDLYMQAGSHIEIQGKSVTMRATGPGGIRLESAADGIGIEALTRGVTVQGQTGISLKAPGEKVALEGGQGVTVRSVKGPVQIGGGPDVEVNVNPITTVPALPTAPPWKPRPEQAP